MEGQPELNFETEWKQLTQEIPNIKYFKSVEEKRLIDIFKKFIVKLNEYITAGQFNTRFFFTFDKDINKNMQEKFTAKLKSTFDNDPIYSCYAVSYVPEFIDSRDNDEVVDSHVCVNICI